MLQILRGKQKYQVTNAGVEKMALLRLLVQCNNEFKMTEIQRKHHRKLKTVLTNKNYFWALNRSLTLGSRGYFFSDIDISQRKPR